MKTTTDQGSKSVTTVAARIAGEDIAAGDYVTILSETLEIPSFLWNCSEFSLPPDEPVRSRFLSRASGNPNKVVAVCLPFVYVKSPAGTLSAFDTRRQELVRLDRTQGRLIWKSLQKQWKPRKKRKSKGKCNGKSKGKGS
ncbi:hypothetical protein [Allorhodopirellula solitaria]|uniref:Uncharacterized protein n=1 Tax=Allorhodopirellula solitaria TaxID=2527987 RepID=A0A5C5YAY0_9BACT|nr:hypothetical protein [Allorhodopirellula solitaria]TWT72866.1 hypothetical protein CA85_13270 [Allorhodopirellula solitaria]